MKTLSPINLNRIMKNNMNDTYELHDRVMQEISGERNPHRQNIALLSYELLSAVDMQMAAHIGFDGSILNEIHKRVHGDGRQHSIDITGIDPKLGKYVLGSQVFIEVPQPINSTQIHQSFQVDCLVGMFTPSIRMRTHDGYVNVQVHTGHDNSDFSHITISRIFESNVGIPSHKRVIETFPVPSRPTGRTNELRVVEYVGLDTHISMEYEAVGIAGDLRMVDGQSVIVTPGPFGTYHRDTATITWKNQPRGYATPHIIDDPHSLILQQGLDARFSFLKETNLYEEVRFILQSNSDIRLSK